MKHRGDRVSVGQAWEGGGLRMPALGRALHRQGAILEFDSPEANQLKSHGAI
jgi:hypothetical protein